MENVGNVEGIKSSKKDKVVVSQLQMKKLNKYG